jgi:hypothetical protein
MRMVYCFVRWWNWYSDWLWLVTSIHRCCLFGNCEIYWGWLYDFRSFGCVEFIILVHGMQDRRTVTFFYSQWCLEAVSTNARSLSCWISCRMNATYSTECLYMSTLFDSFDCFEYASRGCIIVVDNCKKVFYRGLCGCLDCKLRRMVGYWIFLIKYCCAAVSSWGLSDLLRYSFVGAIVRLCCRSMFKMISVALMY